MSSSEYAIKSISDIKTALLRPAQTSQYYVKIPVPPLLSKLAQYRGRLKDQINLLCCEASLPGVSLATSLNDNDRTGVTEEFAYRKNFDRRLDLTFYVDAENYSAIKYFEAWMRFIAGEDLSRTSNQSSANNYHYRFRYPSEYMCQQGLDIEKFEKDLNYYKNLFEKNLDKEMVCTNPDLIVDRGDKRELCAGSVAMVFEKMGGKVVYFGKPYPEVYNLSINNKGKKILSVGDNLNTDIKGANLLNYDSLLISNGIHRNEIKNKGIQDVSKEYEAIVNFIQSDLKW